MNNKEGIKALGFVFGGVIVVGFLFLVISLLLSGIAYLAGPTAATVTMILLIPLGVFLVGATSK